MTEPESRMSDKSGEARAPAFDVDMDSTITGEKPRTLFDWLGVGVFLVLMGMVILQFVSRYVFNSSIGWTEEMARYCLIVATFVGSICVFERNAHIAIPVLREMLPRPVAWVTETVVDLVVVGFLLAMAWYAWGAAERVPGTMTSVNLPKNLIHYTVAVTFLCMSAVMARVVWRRLTHGKSSEIDQHPTENLP